MSTLDLRRLVAQGEGQHLEFKRKANHPEKIVKELVAFANTSGGTLLLGVGDDGTLAGLRHPDEEAFIMEQTIGELVRPQLIYSQTYVRLEDGAELLRYDVEESYTKPHFVAEPDVKKMAYVRRGDRSIKASAELVEIMRRRSANKEVKVEIGEKEQLLLRHLDSAQSTTVDQYAQLADIKPAFAARSLILLVLSNILDIVPSERGDEYVVKG